jgi:phosphatidylglycerol:prolipoprotein diacylglycerol transferase
MCRTLFYIPNAEIAGLPIFGRGWLLLAWAVFGVVLLIRLVRKQGPEGEVWGYVPLLVLVAAAIWWLLPAISEPIPGSELKGLPIRGYGTMLLVAVGAAVALAAWRARRAGIDPELIFALAFWLFVPGIIGARLFYVIEYWGDFVQADSSGNFLWLETLQATINITKGGQTVYGSLIGAMAGLAGFLYVHRLPPLATLDLVAPSFMLGMAIGRIGCFLNGCCFGHVSNSWVALRFPRILEPGRSPVPMYNVGDQHIAGSPPFIQHLQQVPALVEKTDAWSMPVLPTQLFAVGYLLVIFAGLSFWLPRRWRDGEVGWLYLVAYGTARFVNEFFRVTPPAALGLSVAQLLCVGMVVVGGVMLWRTRMRARQPVPEPWEPPAEPREATAR